MVGVSELLTGIIKEKKPLNVKIECLPYGAPIPEKMSVLNTNDNLKLVYAGRMMEQQKRISEVTRALCRVAKEIPGTECVLYGSGKDLKKVQEIISTAGIGLAVHYGGSLETQEVQAHFIQNHIFVLLSDYEGLPISLMEAMAAGLVPVCLHSRSGMGELITNNQTGFLVNNRGNDFVNVIRKLKSDYGLWHTISAAARKKIVEEYSEEACNKRWLQFFENVSVAKKNDQPITIPAMAELRSLYYPTEFQRAGKAMPSKGLVPFYKLKAWTGRIKRNLFRQKLV